MLVKIRIIVFCSIFLLLSTNIVLGQSKEDIIIPIEKWPKEKELKLKEFHFYFGESPPYFYESPTFFLHWSVISKGNYEKIDTLVPFTIHKIKFPESLEIPLYITLGKDSCLVFSKEGKLKKIIFRGKSEIKDVGYFTFPGNKCTFTNTPSIKFFYKKWDVKNLYEGKVYAFPFWYTLTFSFIYEHKIYEQPIGDNSYLEFDENGRLKRIYFSENFGIFLTSPPSYYGKDNLAKYSYKYDRNKYVKYIEYKGKKLALLFNNFSDFIIGVEPPNGEMCNVIDTEYFEILDKREKFALIKIFLPKGIYEVKPFTELNESREEIYLPWKAKRRFFF